MDWSKATVSERKALYRAVKNAVASKGEAFDQLIPEILDMSVSEHYRSTLRAGKYSGRNAVRLFFWLEQNDPVAAKGISGTSFKAVTTNRREQNTSDPVLLIPAVDNTEETRFLFRSRALPYIHPEDAFEQLDRLMSDARPFVWHVLSGSGGTGKSLLALEYAFRYARSEEVQIGFLSIECAKDFDWRNWRPNHPTFIIIDYAARESDLVSAMLEALAAYKNSAVPIRLLLLEREITGAWFNKIIQRGRSARAPIEHCWFGEDGTLEAPEDVWPVVRYMCRDCPEKLPARKKAMSELERIDHKMRPLFAAFLGHAYARGQNPRHWDSYELVENVLNHERRYWQNGGVEQSHINLCACATSTAGIPGEWLESLSSHDMSGFWPEWKGLQTIETLSAVFGAGIVDDIPPLEPDILGEVFFFQEWKAASRYERSRLLSYGSKLAPWFAEFLERLILDFPSLQTDDLLSNFLKHPVEQADNVKCELTYNVITYLANFDPIRALQTFKKFEEFDRLENQPYAGECIIDSALNLIVGIENLSLEDALEVYHTLRRLFAAKSLTSGNARSWCGVTLSIIARYPLSEPEAFRVVLADTLRLQRACSFDDAIRRDTCIALSNYVNLLDSTMLGHAKRMLALFCRLAKGETDGDMDFAWKFILYHVFLLHLAQLDTGEGITDENTTSALRQMTDLVPEFPIHQSEIVDLLKKDLAEDEQ